MTVIYVASDEEEEEVNGLLSKVPGWEKRYTVKRGPDAKLTNVLNGREVEWFSGMPAVRSLLTDGYVALEKFCPYMQRQCIKTECALYLIQRGVGDCAHFWAGLKE